MIYKTLAGYYDFLASDQEATQDWVDYTRRYVRKGKILDLACGEAVIIMLKGKNAVSKRVSELPQSLKFEKLKELERKNIKI